MCSNGQTPSTEGGPSPVKISKSSLVTDLPQTNPGTAMPANDKCMSPWRATFSPHRLLSSPCFRVVFLLKTQERNIYNITHSDTTVSLPLLEACWGPEHALSRYELGENSSSGLVSMIWWEVLLSSNGIWQLTGGGLWELGSWADGRRLDEDVGGMGRPGKEDRGGKGQQWVSWEHPEKVTLNHLTIQIAPTPKKEMLQIYLLKWFEVSPNVQMCTTGSCIFQKMGIGRNLHLKQLKWHHSGKHLHLLPLPAPVLIQVPIISHWTLLAALPASTLAPYPSTPHCPHPFSTAAKRTF